MWEVRSAAPICHPILNSAPSTFIWTDKVTIFVCLFFLESPSAFPYPNRVRVINRGCDRFKEKDSS
jgi:hypothetical protein